MVFGWGGSAEGIPTGAQGAAGGLHCSTGKEWSPYLYILGDSFQLSLGVFFLTTEVCAPMLPCPTLGFCSRQGHEIKAMVRVMRLIPMSGSMLSVDSA